MTSTAAGPGEEAVGVVEEVWVVDDGVVEALWVVEGGVVDEFAVVEGLPAARDPERGLDISRGAGGALAAPAPQPGRPGPPDARQGVAHRHMKAPTTLRLVDTNDSVFVHVAVRTAPSHARPRICDGRRPATAPAAMNQHSRRTSPSGFFTLRGWSRPAPRVRFCGSQENSNNQTGRCHPENQNGFTSQFTSQSHSHL